MGHRSSETSNLEALDRFWRRRPFHDMVVEEIRAINRRVLIRLVEFTLIISGVTDLTRCDTPAVWLDASISARAGRLLLEVETDSGPIVVTGIDLRLIRNSDLALLIPAIDT